jgi:hypothetical protein
MVLPADANFTDDSFNLLRDAVDNPTNADIDCQTSSIWSVGT